MKLKFNKIPLDKIQASTQQPITAAESYGWVVEDWEAWDAYEFALDHGWDEEDLNAQILKAMSSEELAACLAYIFRMNDFREWDEYHGADEE